MSNNERVEFEAVFVNVNNSQMIIVPYENVRRTFAHACVMLFGVHLFHKHNDFRQIVRIEIAPL